MSESVLCTADLKKMRSGKLGTIAECVTECQTLSTRGPYGIVTPIFEEQYLVLGTNFTASTTPIWLGLLLANESIIWNRYSPKQTVHSIAPYPGPRFTSTLDNVVLWFIKSKTFELPVYYHDGRFVVDPRRGAMCICEKGEIFITSGGQTRQILRIFYPERSFLHQNKACSSGFLKHPPKSKSPQEIICKILDSIRS